MAININSNFQVGSPEPLDTRMVLTKEQMVSMNDAIMPEVYMALENSTGQLYLYNKSNEVDATTGKFRLMKTEGGALVFTKAEWEALDPKPAAGTQVIISDDTAPSGEDIINDDTTDATDKTWSAKKINDSLADIESDLNTTYNFTEKEIKSHDIAHRGSWFAPENTISAWIMAKNFGYDGVETDIAYTKDNIPVCIHDTTIDRTSNGSGTVANMTLAELRQYSYNNGCSGRGFNVSIYDGVKLPTFEDYIITCKTYGLHGYIHVHSFHNHTEERVHGLVDIVNKYNMMKNVTFITEQFEWLNWIKEYDRTARLGVVLTSFTDEQLFNLLALKTPFNDVFLDFDISNGTLTDDIVNTCIENNIPLEYQIKNDDTPWDVVKKYQYISGHTSARYMPSQWLMYDNGESIAYRGTEASNPTQSVSTDNDNIKDIVIKTQRLDNFVSMYVKYKYTGNPTTSSQEFIHGLHPKFVPRYNRVVMVCGWQGDEMYYARLRILGSLEGGNGRITILETNAVAGTTIETDVVYMI